MWNKQRREKLKAAPFPPDWSRILLERFPLYQRLPDADRKELQGHIQVFLAEKKLEGCGGLEITEEMKVCIAAQACLLLLHRNTDYYPGLRSILVYPTAHFAKTTSSNRTAPKHTMENSAGIGPSASTSTTMKVMPWEIR